MDGDKGRRDPKCRLWQRCRGSFSCHHLDEEAIDPVPSTKQLSTRHFRFAMASKEFYVIAIIYPKKGKADRVRALEEASTNPASR